MSTIVPIHCDGMPAGHFTSQGSGGVFSQTIAHWNPDMPSWMGHNWNGVAGDDTAVWTGPSGAASDSNWNTMGCYVYVDGTDGAGSVRSSNMIEFVFDGSAGTMVVRDSTASTLATVGITTDKWLRLVFKFQRSDTGDAYVWINPWDEPVQRVFSTTSDDFKVAATAPFLEAQAGALSTTPINISDPFYVHDDGANFDTEDTTFGLHRMEMANWTCRHFNNAETASPPVIDYGGLGASSLIGAAGWAGIEEKPTASQSNTVAIVHVSPYATARAGAFRDDGTEGGPSGNAGLGETLMAHWTFEKKRNLGGKNNSRMEFTFGSSSSRVTSGIILPGTSFSISAFVEGFDSAGAASVPTTSETAALGWNALIRAAGADTTITVSDCYCNVLVKEKAPRYVNSNGKIQWLIGATA